MTILEMVRIALNDLGPDATNSEVREFVWTRFCKAIDERFVPVYRATMRGEELLREARELAVNITREDAEVAAEEKQSA